MPKMIVSIDGVVIKEVQLTKDRTTLGRRPYNDIVIDNLAVSGEHAVMQMSGNDVTLEDLNSTNGTYVNGKAIKKQALQNGDTVEIGKYKIKFVHEGASDNHEKTMVINSGAVVGAAAPVLVAAGIVERARAGHRVGANQVVAASATYVLVGAIALLADPYCSALLGESVMLDARAPMMAVLLLVAPRPGVVAAIMATVVLSHIGAALAWNQQWVLCGPQTAQAGVYVVAALGAAWLFVGRIDRLTSELADARAQAALAQARIGAELSIRAEEELWVADTLGSAQELLTDIAEGRRSPREATTRAACAAEAQHLRALLGVGRASMSLRRPARIWLRLLHAHGCRVQIRGSFTDLAVPSATIGSIGGVVDAICSTAPGAVVTISAWPGSEPSMVVTAGGPAVGRAGPALLERVDRSAGDAWVEVDPDELTLEWSWSGAIPAVGATSG